MARRGYKNVATKECSQFGKTPVRVGVHCSYCQTNSPKVFQECHRVAFTTKKGDNKNA